MTLWIVPTLTLEILSTTRRLCAFGIAIAELWIAPMKTRSSRHLLSAAMCLFAAGTLVGCATNRTAKPAEKETDLVDALDQAKPDTVLDPANSAVRRGNSLRAQGMLDDALKEFEKAIETNPTLTVAFMGAGDIYRQKGDYVGAEKQYGTAAQLEPQNFDAQYLHGLTLQLLNRAGDAVRAYLRALSVKPDDFNANLNVATAYLQLGEPSQALTFAERAVRINSQSAPGRTNLGAVYNAMGRYEDAVIEYQQAAELAPLTAPLLLNLADALGKSGRTAEMVNTLEQLTKTAPSANAYERLGSGLFKLRRYDDSLATFRRAIEIDVNHYPAINGIAVCKLNEYLWSEEKNEEARQEALRMLRRSLQLERRQPKIMELLGRYN